MAEDIVSKRAEEWRSIPDLPGYEVSNLGRVRSLRRAEPVIMRLIDDSGYKKVGLVIGRRTRQFFVHRLVYLAFIGPIQPGMWINHVDTKPGNNSPHNLEQLPPGLNNMHAQGYSWYRALDEIPEMPVEYLTGKKPKQKRRPGVWSRVRGGKRYYYVTLKGRQWALGTDCQAAYATYRRMVNLPEQAVSKPEPFTFVA